MPRADGTLYSDDHFGGFTMTRLILFLVAFSCFALFGCGQSGPLYLPGDPSEIRQAPKPVESADDEEDDDGNDDS